MSKEPLVSIGIPAFNEEKFIKDALLSALNQTYKNIEIIVSDNCSTDGTYSIIKEIAATDKRIKYLRNQSNIGSTGNFVQTLKNSVGEYFCWLGAHDIMLPDNIQNCLRAFSSSSKNVVMVYPMVKIFDSDMNRELELDYANDDLNSINLPFYEKLFKNYKNSIGCYSFHGLFKRDVLLKLVSDPITSKFDHLLLFHAIFFGDIIQSNHYGFKVRQVRIETIEQAYERVKRYLKIESNKNIYIDMVIQTYWLVMFYRPLNLIQNIKLIRKMQTISFYKFGVRKKDILFNFPFFLIRKLKFYSKFFLTK